MRKPGGFTMKYTENGNILPGTHGNLRHDLSNSRRPPILEKIQLLEQGLNFPENQCGIPRIEFWTPFCGII